MMVMILPNKYVTISESYVGLSALLLEIIGNKKMTIDSIWKSFTNKYVDKKKIKSPPTFQKIIFVLEFMYITGMINYEEGGKIFNENLKS